MPTPLHLYAIGLTIVLEDNPLPLCLLPIEPVLVAYDLVTLKTAIDKQKDQLYLYGAHISYP